MCLAARLRASAGMQELVLPPRFGRDGTGMTLRSLPALAKREESGQSCSKALALFSLGQRTSQGPNRTLQPHPLLQQDRSWPLGAARALFSFIFFYVF